MPCGTIPSEDVALGPVIADQSGCSGWGTWVKTLPSRLDARDLARLAAAGARPAGPPPLPPASGDVIEVERTVNASGNVSLGNRIISAGLPLAGQRVTLRLDGPVVRILSGGILARTVACPVPGQARAGLRGGRGRSNAA